MPEDDKVARQTTFYVELQKHIQSADYEKAVKSCNRLLHEAPDDGLAFECKIVALVNLGRYEDAITYCGKNPTLAANLNYEIAYCYYRLNKTQEALETLDKINIQDPRKKELFCQILYRLERYDECYDLYKEVIKGTSDSYEEERQSNMTAIAASLRFTNETRKLTVEKGATFEHQYNYACFLVAEHKYELAEKVLLEAMKTCEETLREEVVSEDEIQDELCVMKALRGYICQKLGRDQEASHIYTEIMKIKPSEVSVAAIVSNNIVVQNKDQNVFESKKRIKTMSAEDAGHKLTSAQKLTIQVNQCLYYLYTHQYEACKELYIDLLDGKGKECDDLYALATYHNLLIGNRVDFIHQKYLSYVKGKPNLDLRIKLGTIQVVLEKGEAELATSLAKLLNKQWEFPLGLTSLYISLLRLYGKKEDVSECFKEAIDYYFQNLEPERKKSLEKLLKQAAAYEIEIGNKEQAQAILRKLLEVNKNPDVLGAALMLTVSLNLGDKGQMKNLMASLPKPKLDEGFSMDSIESESVLGNLKYIKKAARGAGDIGTPSVTQQDPSAALKKTKKKKKKKAKLPENYDPNRSPDPERWLPRYERSGYKPKKTRRGRADVGKGTQGAATEASDVYDMSRGGAGATNRATPSETPQYRRAHKKKGKH